MAAWFRNDPSLSDCGVCAKKGKGLCQYSQPKNVDVDAATTPALSLINPLAPGGHGDWRSVNRASSEKTYFQQSANATSSVFSNLSAVLSGSPDVRAHGRPPQNDSNVSIVTQESTPKPQEHGQVGGADSMTGSTESRGAQGFFGSSSASSFMQQVKTAIDARLLVSSPSYPRADVEEQVPVPSNNEHAPSPAASLEYDLPHRRMADKFLALYWEIIHPLYPFLDRVEFERSYSSLWTGETYQGDERMLICMLDIIFALSCQLSDSIKLNERSAAAEIYFQRSQYLLNVRLWDVGSIETIQCLLLMGQYLQSTSNAHQCWMVIGHAVRVAQGLGLHLSEASIGNRTCREREHIRRIWHGCVFMDR